MSGWVVYRDVEPKKGGGLEGEVRVPEDEVNSEWGDG